MIGHKLILMTMLCILFFVGCDLTKQERFITEELDYAEEQGETIRVYEYKNDQLLRLTTADKVDRFYERRRTDSINIVITDYNPDGSIKTIFSADNMSIDEVRDIYTATGNVVIEQVDTILYTEHLVWDQSIDEIYSPVEITLIRGDNILKGFEFRSDSNFHHIELSMVTAEGKLDEEDLLW